jgi:hypothetical protein
MNSSLQEFLDCVNDASPEALLSSKRNCHAANISSIVLGKSPFGGLSRVFLAWPGHKLLNNNLHGEMVVGIHDHKYNITLQHIFGHIINTTYKETDKHGVNLFKYNFSSGVVNGSPKTEYFGEIAMLKEKETEQLGENTLHLSANEFHDISCGIIAAWWVHEGKTEKETTTLFTKRGSLDMSGLYDSFNSVEEVKAHINEFISLGN